MRRKRDTEPPWVTVGMSRASWYRYGKPDSKPQPPRHRWFTQKVWSQVLSRSIKPLPGLSVRSLQRMARLQRWTPDLVEQIRAKKLTMGEAERILIARQDRAPEGSAAANAARRRRNRQALRLL
jgi:hypothetical protein